MTQRGSAEPEDPYAVLGVTPRATVREVDAAFRALVRQHHPDTRPPADSTDDGRLRQILAAYETLRDPGRRAAYDRKHNLARPASRTEPARTEPARTEPARTNSARTEPARTNPATTREPWVRAGPVRWTPPVRRGG